MSAGKSARLSIREIAELSLFCALMVAGKECLRLIPNVHPVTLLLLLATAVYGAKALYPAFGFALLEIALYGAGSRMTVKGAVQLRNICDVRFDAAISVRTTSEKPLTAPPAGATIITLPPVMPIAA